MVVPSKFSSTVTFLAMPSTAEDAPSAPPLTRISPSYRLPTTVLSAAVET